MQCDEPQTASVTALPYLYLPFTACGDLDGRHVSAEATDDELRLDTALYERADLIVALGETFSDPEVDVHYPASLAGETIATLLTVLRAMDVIHSFSMCFRNDAALPGR